MPQKLGSKNIGFTCTHHREVLLKLNPAKFFKLPRHCLRSEIVRFRWKWSNFTGERLKVQHGETRASFFIYSFEWSSSYLADTCVITVQKDAFLLLLFLCAEFFLWSESCDPAIHGINFQKLSDMPQFLPQDRSQDASVYSNRESKLVWIVYFWKNCYFLWSLRCQFLTVFIFLC